MEEIKQVHGETRSLQTDSFRILITDQQHRKEFVAEFKGTASKRAGKRFVSQNCSTSGNSESIYLEGNEKER